TEYQECVDSCGNYTRYTDVDEYDDLLTIRQQIVANITSCEEIKDITQDCKIDIVFIVDDTDTISPEKFQEMKTFLLSLVSKMVIGDDAIRLGVVTYADDGDIVFPLNQYTTSAGLKSGISNLVQGNTAYNRTRRRVEKALLYTMFNFFTTANGDRADAKNFYVVLTYGGSYGMQAAQYGGALQYNSMVDIFILAADIPSSFDADFQGAVLEGRYMKSSNFIDLQCDNEVVMSNITQCPTENATEIEIPNCKLDILFMLEASSSSAGSNFVYLKSFFANIARQLNVASDSIRIGAMTYDYKGYKQFDLDTYTTADEVSNAIMRIQEGVNPINLVDRALAYARTVYFTEDNGDRADAANYYVFSVDGIRAGASLQGAVITADWPNQIYSIDINSSFSKEYKKTADDINRYFFASSYEDLPSIEAAVVEALSKCPTPRVITTTGVSLRNKGVTAPCLNSLIYLYPEDLTAYTSGSRGMMYLMTDFVFRITSCSRITSWEFSYSRSGWIDFMVWRPSGNNYKLVAFNTLYVEGVNTTTYTVVEYERIAVLDGDLIGWRSLADNDDGNIITNGNCIGPCAEGLKAYSAKNLIRGDLFDWKTKGTVVNTTAYAIKACLEENTPMSFNNQNQSAEIPDHLAVGDFVMVLEAEGVDYAEDVTFTVMEHPNPAFNYSPQYFVVDGIGQVKIAKKMQRATVLKDYLVRVAARDACNTSATVTVSVESQNMPPEMLDLPNSMAVAEQTGGDQVLYSTIVEDPSGDEVCCLLESVSPPSLNFNVTGNSTAGAFRGVFSILTSANPAFSYKDVNSYMVKLCCDDSADKTTGILLVNVKKPVKGSGYTPP
ncbi:uncharacterized protein LOC134274328, partial [Saccostrea cucullata]|uniref:uncharacterized protein LOC134274328 n=1 Tax=Saccostrea cuccullata TaxID=36930 RepID=UPI002ECFDF66